jgi:hypothetical protein
MAGMKQFSIRDLLMFVLIVGLALGWWLDRRQAASRFQLSTTTSRVFLVDTTTGQVWTRDYAPGNAADDSSDLLPPKITK